VNTMNTQSNAMPEARTAVPGVMKATQPFFWSVQRELWEIRSIYVAPLAAGGLIVFGSLLSTVHLASKMRAAMALDPMKQMERIQQPYNFAALLMMGVYLVVAVFYCLDALHGERRDRSILFWKSMPVSDLTTVLSKAFIPVVILPLITFAITFAVQWIMLLIGSLVLLAHGMSAAILWRQLPLTQMWVMLFFHLFAIHGVYWAPIYAWLILVSGWARRAVFLWAGLPLLAVGVVEKIAFNTAHFGRLLLSQLVGGKDIGSMTAPGNEMMHPLTLGAVGQFLVSPGLWIGLAFAAVFLAAAVRLRRYQGPI